MLNIFWPFEKKGGLNLLILEGKLDGKRERGRPRRQWERDIRDVFDGVPNVGRLIIDRNRFRCAFNDATFYGDKQ